MDNLLLLLRVALALAVVVAAIWWLRRRVLGGKTVSRLRKHQPVQVIGRQPVGKNASVVVVDSNGQRLLLGVTDHQITVLQEAAIPQFQEELDSIDTGQAASDADLSRAITYQPAQGQRAGAIFSPAAWKRFDATRKQGTKL